MSVRLVELPIAVLESLAAGDMTSAGEALGIEIPGDVTRDTSPWGFFASSGWPVNAVVHGSLLVGDAGFKGTPDTKGAIEIGYQILAAHRRRGYAVAAVKLLLKEAKTNPDVKVIRAEVEPSNRASIAVLKHAGFTPDGERTHPKDGQVLTFTHVAR